MPVTLDQLLATPMPDRVMDYTEKDLILYALGVGMGSDPLDEEQLRFVYEKDLAVLPTALVVLPYLRIADLDLGLNYQKIVHGEQWLTMHNSPRPAGRVIARSRLDGVIDKGPEKGLIVALSREVHDLDTGEHLASIGMSLMARGDGGIGGSGEAPPPMGTIPDRAPDATCVMPVSLRSALIYRLSGDINPLHTDPAAARKAGFDRPILHGLATFGFMGHAVVRQMCGYDPARLKSLRGRFSAPVFPGDTIEVDFWNEPGGVALRARVPARDVTVFNNGFADLA